MDVEHFRNLQSFYKMHYYSVKVAEQVEDETFYRDEFTVPQLESVIRVSRTGDAARLVNIPVAQLASAQLKVSRRPLKETVGARDAALNISRLLNQEWIPMMMRGNPNPKLAFLKYLILRGEAYIHPLHNQEWVTAPFKREGLPVHFLVPDPINIYSSPNENNEGVPEHVLVNYERIQRIVQSLYPSWTNPEGKEENETIQWWEYWDKDTRLFEADGQVVLESKNPYGFVPFVRKVSGWGTESPDGKPEDSVVGILRNTRELLRRLCANASDKDWIMHNFANRSIDVQPIDDQHQIPKNFRQKYSIGSGLIHELPFGITVTRAVEELPEVQYFQYENELRTLLDSLTPLALSGSPIGSSGRQQDISISTALKLFMEQAERTKDAFETAFAMGLEMCDKIPKLMPDGISKEDLGKVYTVQVDLESEDPIEEDRVRTMGSRLYQQGEIDLFTNLTKYQGFTEEEADKIMARILVDNVTRNNPVVAEIMGRHMAREIGLEQEYAELKMQTQMKEGMPAGIPQTGSQGGAPRVGNIQTERGMNEADLALAARGARRSPVA